MAEASITSYLWAVVVGLFLTTILVRLRKTRVKKETKRNEEIAKAPYYSDKEKRNFRKAIPLGMSLGILVYLQHFFAMFNVQPQWYVPIIQIDPIVIYLTLLFYWSGFQFFVAFTNFQFVKRNKGFADGMFAAFTVIQIIVFVKFPLEFFPTIK
jgi:hypothetical protein